MSMTSRPQPLLAFQIGITAINQQLAKSFTTVGWIPPPMKIESAPHLVVWFKTVPFKPRDSGTGIFILKYEYTNYFTSLSFNFRFPSNSYKPISCNGESFMTLRIYEPFHNWRTFLAYGEKNLGSFLRRQCRTKNTTTQKYPLQTLLLLLLLLLVKSTVKYGAETWKFNKNLGSKLMSMEMDFLRRSARCKDYKKLDIMLLDKNGY